MDPQFQNREDAGRGLADALSEYANNKDTVILALPRGGVPIAYEVAKTLQLPMDVWIVRKLGIPGDEEVAMGAISLGGVCYTDHDLINKLGISELQLEDVMAAELAEMHRRNETYRENKPPPDVKGKNVIIIDDGLATGSTIRAAIMALKESGAHNIIAAIPVGPVSECKKLEQEINKVICLCEVEPFYGVGMWYEDFSQVPDEDVKDLLENQPWVLD